MTDWNPVTVENALWDLKERIAKGVLIVDKAYGEFQDADEEFVVAEAKAYLNCGEYPANQRQYHTVLATVAERQKRRLAERVYKKAVANMKALTDGLHAVQSIGSGVREAYRLAGVGER